MSDVTASRSHKVRWSICVLLFFATTINYLDRQLFSVLVPYLEDDLRLGPVDLSLINVSFLLSYGLGMLLVGLWIDKVGVKRGLGIAFLLWNIAAALPGLIGGFRGLVAVRALLGVSEAANYPACVKTVGEWFPRQERATANGWFNAGSNVGAILAPLIAITLAETVGWRNCFFLLGSVGLVWVVFWFRLYHPMASHPGLSTDERELIESGQDAVSEPITYSQLLAMRPVWALALAKCISESPWWFYLTWLPKFLSDEFKVDATFMRIAIPVVYIIADIGAVGGGWLSSKWISEGKAVGSSRKRAMLVCALSALGVLAVGPLMAAKSIAGIPAIYPVIGLVSIAAAAHQGWSSNLYTIITDTVPSQGVAKTVGIATAAGVTGASIFQVFVGKSVELTGSYAPCFVIAGSLYLVALGVLHLLLPEVRMWESSRRVSVVKLSGVAAGLVLALLGLQSVLIRPKWNSVADYEQSLGKTGSTFTTGPNAKVGWMDAKWYIIRTSKGDSKLELVKLDDAGRPTVEKKKPEELKKYKGPSSADLQKLSTGTSPGQK